MGDSIGLGMVAMREHRSKSGKLIYYATRAELERLKGYRGNDRRGRACCPIHDGDNPTALSIDWGTGWASCFSCGDSWVIRVEDHPDAWKAANDPKRSRTTNPPRSQEERHSEARSDPQSMPRRLGDARAGLLRAVATAVEALPASPGAAYLAERGIPLDVAGELGIGWGTRGVLANRVVFPLSGPDGIPTSATARRIHETDNRRDPKYRTLEGKAGYVKTLFNGGAIGSARQSGHPLIVVEGPLDAAACVAAGLPLVVAIGSTSYAYPDHFAGLTTVILALDGDQAGQDGRRALWLELVARGIDVLLLPADALEGHKDLGEYWQRFRRVPMQLATRSYGPHLASLRNSEHAVPLSPVADHDGEGGIGTIDAGSLPSLEELQGRSEEAGRYLSLTPDDLPEELRSEAEALALELAGDLDVMGEFMHDLLEREHLLMPEDRCAAWYVLRYAIGGKRPRTGEIFCQPLEDEQPVT